MKSSRKIVVYGSYGYTGKLIVLECRSRNLDVVLAGRNEALLEQQAKETGYPFSVVESGDADGLRKLLEPAALVIHSAGPFRHTAVDMVKACLATQTNYTDITGEYQVFESLAGMDDQAKKAGIMIMPGTGFDVVPSDCLALHLKNRLPSATHLQLAFTMSKGGLSRGTRKSMIEGLGYGGYIRKDSNLHPIALGEKWMEIDFGAFKTLTICIPWGDISTAWRSTSIPNIEVYTGATEGMIRNARRSNYLGWLLRMKWLKNILLKQVDKRPPGPSAANRESGRSFLWGTVWDASGKKTTTLLDTMSGYALTAKTAVLIGEKILEGKSRPGYQTPAMAYGPDLIMEIEGTKRRDL